MSVKEVTERQELQLVSKTRVITVETLTMLLDLGFKIKKK